MVSLSARRSKIMGKRQASETESAAAKRLVNVRSVLSGGSRVLVQGWEQPGAKGSRWVMTEWEIFLEDLVE